MGLERLQKILAGAGVASRRAAEDFVAAGRVRVNGRVVRQLGAKADPNRDKIEVDGRKVMAEAFVYYLLHKPRGVVTTLNDPEGRPTIRELLRGVTERVFPVGRLDYSTSGALLITNDGALADAILHPRKGVPKTYVAKVRGQVTERSLELLQNGVTLDDGTKTSPAHIVVLREEGPTTWLQITLTEGKNRQIHRMAKAVGHQVMRLARLSFAGLNTEGLRPGEWRPLTQKELEKLKKSFLAASSSSTRTTRASLPSGASAGRPKTAVKTEAKSKLPAKKNARAKPRPKGR